MLDCKLDRWTVVAKRLLEFTLNDVNVSLTHLPTASSVKEVTSKIFRFYCVYGTSKLRFRAFKWLKAKLGGDLSEILEPTKILEDLFSASAERDVSMFPQDSVFNTIFEIINTTGPFFVLPKIDRHFPF